MRPCILLLGLLTLALGCQRSWYRRDADRETYSVEGQHEDESRWPVANTNIRAPYGSRLFDPFDPDFPPLPPDDPAAYFFMLHPDGQPATKTYHRDGDAPFIEDPSWRYFLDLDKNGNLVLTPETAVELGLLHSREYQRAMESLYLSALSLTLNRFEFDAHWFATNNTIYTHFGSGPTELSTLTSNSDIGFSRNLATGGQLLVDFANSLVFTFSPVQHTIWPSSFSAALIQPLLRGAGLRVRLEGLTQAERDVLYSVRDFARFRKLFYFGLTSGGAGGYLSLLQQVQSIRNLESNLHSQEQNLLLTQALEEANEVSAVQVDQAFQGYQSAQFNLIQARSALESAFDQYKNALGLPPDVPIKLDDTILEPFQLVSPDLERLQKELDRLFAEYREQDKAPTVEVLHAGYNQLRALQARLAGLTGGAEKELELWQRQANGATTDVQSRREKSMREAIARAVAEMKAELNKTAKDLLKDSAALTEGTRDTDWKRLLDRFRLLIADASDLFLLQTQIRVFLIQLEPIPYTLNEAAEYARDNRLDLMNFRGQVVDAWRKIEVTASALKAGLDLHATANVATRPDSTNPVDFRASASQYTVGLAFDGPLDRMAARNDYASSLITYQQARRSFMALDDQIQIAIRADIRQLETERANFGIARQSLISAARQVEFVRKQQRFDPSKAGPTATLDILNALSNLLQAKNTLISSWINYETGRTRLLLDMDALQLDARGLPSNEPDNATNRERPRAPGSNEERLPPATPEPASGAGR